MTAGRKRSPAKKEGAWKRILKLLKAKYPEKVNTKEIEEVARISDYQRRIRELRAAGWEILSHHDDPDLKPDEYRLRSLKQKKNYLFSKRIDGKTRALVLQRNGFTCSACGRGVDDDDPVSPGRKVRLHVDHIDPDGDSTPDNLRILCSACNQGKQDLILPRSAINLLQAIRRASRKDQLEVFNWLKNKFEKR